MTVNVLNPSLALLTDLYQLTMAYGYWRHGMADRAACFHVTFRRTPFAGGYAIACGLAAAAIEYLKNLHFSEDDVAYLATLEGNDARPLFDRAFLSYLRELRFALDIDAIPEGTVVFANEPLIRVTGPLMQAQIVETALLNMLNFQTLIATKAARVCEAARGDAVRSPPLARRTSADARRPVTSWPERCSAFPCAGRMRTVG
jgi:nicotinate phosphoribosyltransferase